MNSQQQLFAAFATIKVNGRGTSRQVALELADAVTTVLPNVGYGQRFFEAQHFVWAGGRPLRRTGVGSRNPAVMKAIDAFSKTASSKEELYRLLYDNSEASSHACCNAALAFKIN